MIKQLPPEVAEATPAGRLVYLAVKGNALGPKQIAERTGLTERGIRNVANELIQEGVIKSYQNPRDLRCVVYYDADEFNDVIEAHRKFVSNQD